MNRGRTVLKGTPSADGEALKKDALCACERFCHAAHNDPAVGGQRFSPTGVLSPYRPSNVAYRLRLDAIWELHWYFEQRQRVERGDAVEDQAEFDRLGQVFRAPRFWALYRTWQQEGDAVLNGLASSVLADATGRFRGV